MKTTNSRKPVIAGAGFYPGPELIYKKRKAACFKMIRDEEKKCYLF